MSFSGRSGYCALAVALAVAMGPQCARAQDAAATGDPECVPLAEQYPDLGTSQSISARGEFVTSWGSFQLPGGPCGYRSAEEHYNALLADAESRGGPTVHTYDTLPDWSGHWGTDNNTGELAIMGLASTTEGMAARLRPELSSPSLLRREGVSLSFWKAGDRVTVRTIPLIDGRPAGNMRGAITADGRTYGDKSGLEAPAP